MGWLQGRKSRNEQELKHSWEHRTFSPVGDHGHEANALHMENMEHFESPAQVSVSESIQVDNNTQSHNEIEALLVATFERPKIPIQKPTNIDEEQIVISCWPFQDKDVKDEDLPRISRHEVTAKSLTIDKDGLMSETRSEGLWIVVDEIVYDCSNFVHDHPGGVQVILSFVGQDCSWQFWRFHSPSVMNQHGRRLRIGRAGNVPNKFKEQPKYVGLSQLGRGENR